jgi:hypothetical protein
MSNLKISRPHDLMFGQLLCASEIYIKSKRVNPVFAMSTVVGIGDVVPSFGSGRYITYTQSWFYLRIASPHFFISCCPQINPCQGAKEAQCPVTRSNVTLSRIQYLCISYCLLHHWPHDLQPSSQGTPGSVCTACLCFQHSCGSRVRW